MSIPTHLEEHLFLLIKNGDPAIPTATGPVSDLMGQETSGLYWFPTNGIYLRSDRLRPITEPSKLSTPQNPEGDPIGETASIHIIAKTLVEYVDFNSAPALFHFEPVFEIEPFVPVVYEGRHRCIGAELAGREFVLGRQIGPNHSTIIAQHSSTNSKYFKKPIHTLKQIVEIYRNDPTV